MVRKHIQRRMPRTRLSRTIVGVALIIGGILGFLPVLGFWMIPLGLFILSVDSPFVRRQRRKIEIKAGRFYQRYKKSNTIEGEDTVNLPITIEDVRDAYEQIQDVIVRTPLIENQELNYLVGGRVFIKPECLQRTGSFKFRGAYNRISRMSEDERKGGVVAFSSGNHAAGVACAANMLGVSATIVMPTDSPAVKLENTKKYGAKIVLYDRYKEDRIAIAAKIGEETGATVVPSFDDVHIMAGQGTAGLEVAEDLKELGINPDQVLINCGGGGLASGFFTGVKDSFPQADTYVVEPTGFDDFGRSLESGKREKVDPDARSICDAILTDQPGALTFDVIRQLGAKGLVVSDEDALRTVSYAAKTLKLIGEPGGVVSLAALLTGKIDAKDKVSVCIISGGNIDPDMLSKALADY
ncbi:serine/threonine dehydratase [Kordiimonas sediminis]|uniref:Serine/threonine dehydratase n=1 Tax=Kordiimonas sediminis TaxID=1735581 RepID=A0A919E940_9PROT|nr:pyridoxal-phosphate dependent enzyme [Kordiimonas sediminis]GHF26192.1 serine/threonine dehydratase [Kordiimonas sediminis]